MSDYKSTVHLPQTAFPMKANLSEREPQQVQKWNDMKLYELIRQKRKGAPLFILHDGPPYANGPAHLGHAVNRILKDIILKSKTIQGFDTPFVPGWDCHGLPIELNVEKKIGKSKTHQPEHFRQACRDYAMSQIDIQRNALIRLGLLGDWMNPYRTMDRSYEANIVRSLAPMIERGYLKQGYKPVYWCLDCGSALAEAELEYANKHSKAVDVRFEVVEPRLLWERMHHVPGASGENLTRCSIPIWTTTPWTLPANRAVALHPELTYSLVSCDLGAGREYLIVASEMVTAVMHRYDCAEYRVVADALGSELEGLLLQHPFDARTVPVVVGTHVTTEMGTGAVHTAPAHGLEDYQVGTHYQLTMEHGVGPNGVFADDVPVVGGMHLWKANEYLIEHLKTSGHLISLHSIEHSYPHCWRHKTPLIFRATPQWFISLSQTDLREKTLEEIKKVNWIPQWGQDRIESMIMNRPDWCISRQRVWGTPLTLIIHQKTGQLHPRMPQLIEHIATQIEQKGLQYWDDCTLEELLGAQEAEEYQKIHDTLDVWIDSGVSHTCVLKQRPELRYPADLYLEGSDQHRGWFQSSLLTSVAMHGQAPYKNVLTHGFILDTQGNKMSKSLGNVIDPVQIMNTLGADVLRWWVASSDYRSELTVSEDILKRSSEAYRRLRNTARYLLANLHDFDPAIHLLSEDQLLPLDHYMLRKVKLLQQQIIDHYAQYQFHMITQSLHHFCVVDLGGFYLDVIKDRQYTGKKESPMRRSAQTVMFHMLHALVRWMAPILSFTSEEIWHYIPGPASEQSVFLAGWYEEGLPKQKSHIFSDQEWEQLLELRASVNKALEEARVQNQIGSPLEAEVRLTMSSQSPLWNIIQRVGSELRFLLLCSQVDLIDSKQANESIHIEVHSSEHAKCERCWHRRSDVGQVSAHPTICTRCVSNIEGNGESRQFI